MKPTVALLLLCVCSFLHADPEGDSWPRKFSASGSDFTIYQPQVESWKGTQLSERAAVAVQSQAAAEPTFGVLWLSARTDVDKSERLVALEDIKIDKVSFPSDSGQAEQLKGLLQENAAQVLGTISLDRLRASLAIAANENKHQSVNLKNDPPEIYYSETPAVLVLIDGNPVLRESGQENLMRIVNTRALILMNSSDNKYYLFVGGRWYHALQLTGPWQTQPPTGELAAHLEKVKSGLQSSRQVDEAESGSNGKIKMLSVIVSTKPAELIQSQGSPKFEPIAQTELVYVTNSPDNIFLYTADQGYYVTLSGRWFRSNSIKGPWRFVPSDKLPGDFAKIPEGHPKGEILASVAGTAQAQEAVIANEIPQTAAVDRAAAKLEVNYDGAPQFNTIEGSHLQYAVNTTVPVIRDSNGTYYAVENGVWFSSLSPQGPWSIVTDVPADIYSIPPSCPVYNVTYVYVYGADPRFVYVGYLPGYLGSYVNPYGVVVYGTGYYYRPWVHGVWVGYPATYGYGLAWGFGFGWTFRPVFYGAPVYHPWWGPWPHYWAHFNRPVVREAMTINHVNVYRSWGQNVIRPTLVHSYPALHNAAVVRSAQHPMPVVHNNVYADHSGNVYRNSPSGWERYNAKQWQQVQSAPHPTAGPAPHELEREHFARQRGETTVRRYSLSPVPAVHRIGHSH